MVDLFIEGGGDSDAQHTAFRKGWRILLEKVPRLQGRQPRVRASGGRKQAYDALCNAISRLPAFSNCAMLVDSEDAIKFAYSGNCNTDDESVLDHLKERDKWSRPKGYRANHTFLMVCTMENWMLADPAGLERFYGKGFNLPNPPQNPESLTKDQALKMLEDATKSCSNPYEKNIHNYEVLEYLDPAELMAKCPSFKHFVDCVPV